MPRAALTYTPRLLPVDQAAAYLGMSATKLRSLPIPRKVLDGKRLFDRMDLDAYASDLPYEGEALGDEAAWDKRIAGA